MTSTIKKNLLLATLPLLLLAGVSCSEDGTEIGSKWVHVSTRTMIIDSCTVWLTTMKMDSIDTGGTGIIFAGSNADDFFGRTTISSYLTFNTTSDYKVNANEDFSRPVVTFDSLTLILAPHTEYRGDTTLLQKIKVCRLLETVEPDDEGYLYSSTTFNYDANPIAEASIYPHPEDTTWRYEIRLPDVMGQDILQKLIDRDDEVLGDEDFTEYFKGLVLVPDDNGDVIMSFGDSLSMMKLYYHQVADKREDFELTFAINSEKQFNHIAYDRTGSPVELLSTDTPLPSDLAGDRAFLQSMAGIYTKIEFPYLYSLQEMGDHCRITKAALYIAPVRDSYGATMPLPRSVNMYVTDENDTTVDAITDSSGDMDTGYLTEDYEFQENTYYSFDITSFLSQQVHVFGIYKRDLQFVIPDYNTSLNTLVIGDARHSNNIKLSIQLTVYNE